MKKTNTYKVIKAFVLPNGGKAVSGAMVELTQHQAKYLLLGRKIEKVDAPPTAVAGSVPAPAEEAAAAPVKAKGAPK